jgi:asparagine synthase (glutamine-hydrolysing)
MMRTAIGAVGNSRRLTRICRQIDFVDSAWHKSNTIDLAEYWADKYKSKATPLQSSSIFQKNERLDISSYSMSAAGGAAFWDANYYLPDDILVKVDRASMANSLETRAPLLDHRIIEFSLSLPEKYKISRRTGKKVLRSVLYRRVPKSMVDRPKMGFSIPLSKWLRYELKSWGSDLIATVDDHDDILNPQEVRRIWNEHIDGVNDHTDKIWALLILLGFLQ